MQKPHAAYQERLTPSLRVLACAAGAAPMAALVFVPVDSTIALVAGAAVGIALLTLLVALSPVVEVRDGILRAGRARIGVEWLGEPAALSGEDAARARGRDLEARAWMLIRGGIAGLVVVPVDDPDDPVPAWVISTRTPDRLAAAIRRERLRRRSPDRSGRSIPRDPPVNGA